MDFENDNQQPAGTPFPINTALGETMPLNSNSNSNAFNPNQQFLGFTQGSPWNPTQFAQFNPSMYPPPWMYQQPPGMMPHSGMNARSTTSMDVDRTDRSDPGDWVAHPEYRIVSHIHRDIHGCPDLLGHLVTAKRAGDVNLLTALKTIEDDVSRPFKESAQRAKVKVTSLETKILTMTAEHEEKVQALTTSFTDKQNTLQEKYNTALEEKSQLIVEMAALRETADRLRREAASPVRSSRSAPYRRPDDRNPMRRSNGPEGSYISRSTSRIVTIPTSSTLSPDWGNLRVPFPTQAASWTTLEHSGFRPGRDFSLVTIDWAAFDGVGKSSAYVDQCIATNTLPSPTVFPHGPSLGLQAIPTTRGDLKALIDCSSVKGNVGDLLHLRFAYTLAEYIEQGTEFAPSVDPFYAEEKVILENVEALHPLWAQSTKLLDHSTFRIHGVPTDWATPCVIPPVATPDAGHRNDWFQWGLYYFVHGDAHSLLGQLMFDCGIIDIDGVRASRILSETTPPRSGKSREAYDGWRFSFISLISKPQLYQELVAKYHIVINPAIRLTRPSGNPPYNLETVARHFAACGISIPAVNSMIRFGWQFIIDQQHSVDQLSSVQISIRRFVERGTLPCLVLPYFLSGR
ncbi:hypothetical protein AAF712_013122 [Marasmius tenuissimus]|uniref:Uncharacterized protein n=1 Tax=Marasmius tenuissimus TaxID=585030 RepID=A0ABR2ZH57_9AGAR